MSVGAMKDLKTKSEKSTRLRYTGLFGELEHLKIENLMTPTWLTDVHNESRKRELKMVCLL
jgi:hypothetical protein